AQTELELQRLTEDRKVKGAEGIADLLRLLGPLTTAEIAARVQPPNPVVGSLLGAGAPPPTTDETTPVIDQASAGPPVVDQASASERAETGSLLGAGAPPSTTDDATAIAHVEPLLAELAKANRALKVGVAGVERWAAVEDAARLRDALGVPLPVGVPLAFIEPVADPLGDLVSRYARTHGPFTATECARRLGLGPAVVHTALQRLLKDGRVVEGEFRPGGAPDAEDGGAPGNAAMVDGQRATALAPDQRQTEWCDVEVLRKIRRRSLAALRREVEPVDPATYGRFLPAWQNVGAKLRGLDGVVTVVDQLSGVPIPASAWEPLILASRVSDYAPSMLDELTATGEILIAGAGSMPGNDGWISLHLADTAPLTLNPPSDFEPSVLQYELLNALSGAGGYGGAYFFRQLSDLLAANGTQPGDDAVVGALWDLLWAGRITNDTFAPVRTLLAGGTTAHRQRNAPPRARSARLGRMGRMHGLGGAGLRPGPGAGPGSGAGLPRTAPPNAAGRWSLLPAPEADPTVRAHATAELLLDRYGVVTRGSVAAESVPGGFGLMYKVLGKLEETGRCRRGYFIEHLGAAQFAVSPTVDRLRSFSRDAQLGEQAPTAVALAATDPANPYGAALAWPAQESGHRPGRKAGALVVLVDGELALYSERGGKTLLAFTEDEESLALCGRALVQVIRRGAADKMAVEKVNGGPILDTPLARALMDAGFYSTPRGLRFRA
ncbi:ATP-dependent helicase, partial [Arthrobacter sulfonylureivorans]